MIDSGFCSALVVRFRSAVFWANTGSLPSSLFYSTSTTFHFGDIFQPDPSVLNRSRLLIHCIVLNFPRNDSNIYLGRIIESPAVNLVEVLNWTCIDRSTLICLTIAI